MTDALESYTKQLMSNFEYISCIPTTNLENKEFSLKFDDLKDIIEFGVDYNKFSAEDFWFYTNAI